MIIIGQNLAQLSSQYSICDRSLVDDFSLKIQLGKRYFEPNPMENRTVVYGSHPCPTELFSQEKTIGEKNLILKPGNQIIACSKHLYNIPTDHFGLVQTKGTLARLFVQATCNDGQIEPGFSGYITLEIVNLSPWTIDIPAGSDIAQLYLLKCSSPAEHAYCGRYAEKAKEGPTIAIFK